jgi:hypothetical protein
VQSATDDSQRHPKAGSVSVGTGSRMDDLSLEFGRSGLVLGAILGLILGATVWDGTWLVASMVLGFYGAMIGAAVGMVMGLLSRRR